MRTKKLYIQTIGCQMNVYDSGRIAQQLAPLNYAITSEAADADLVIVNTCAIRDKAEQKVFSFLGRMAGLKRKRPELLIGVGGCVAQQLGERVWNRAPYVDVVFGTHAIERLGTMIAKVETQRCRWVDVALSDGLETFETPAAADGNGSVTRFVTIMQGCDNFCSYCVVPYVRGPEASRSPERIIGEIENLVAAGVREVTLLGQNVNSYGRKEKHCSFPQLLSRVNALENLVRIRFTTSNPKDLSDQLCRSFRDLEKLCKHIHLPVQSGSNRVLRKMNRHYTREQYLEKVEQLRALCPEIAISSDFITGFPGETESDFEQTLDLIRTVRFDSVFAFQYSDRPNARAARFENKVGPEEKSRRLQALLKLQERITLEKHQDLLGSTQEVLVEGLNQKGPAGPAELKMAASGAWQWTGRTTTNRIVHFAPAVSKRIFTGKLVRVTIQKARAHSLWGVPAGNQPDVPTLKGANSHAA
jgi:tRNA-2-methylthio-N6-dimethylallyladenosine synthase